LHTQHLPSTLTLKAKNQAHPARLAAVSGDTAKFHRRYVRCCQQQQQQQQQYKSYSANCDIGNRE
jgi:hypothetical protein